MKDNTAIEILRFRRILYAHTHTAHNYSYLLDNRSVGEREGDVIRGGVIEIGFVETNPLRFTDEDGDEHIAPEGGIFIIPPMRRISVKAVNGGLHRHVTVESEVDCRMGGDGADATSLSLPLVIDGRNCEKAAAAIRRAVRSASPTAENGYFRQCADFMNILAELNSIEAVRGADQPPSHVRYCREAERYVADNIERRVSVGEIALAVGISKNYLTNIFSATTGMSLIEYINRMKVSHMAQLMLRFNWSVREAAEHVGIDNANYASRMFKKYFGVTASEYKQSIL